MILHYKKADILASNEKRIAFAINVEGELISNLVQTISHKYWPELPKIGIKNLGTTIFHKANDIELYALCCYSLKNGWMCQDGIIRKCFDEIPGDEPVASIMIGNNLIGIFTDADFTIIEQGMITSKKKIIIYY